ncbi:tripartite motif-containing protein 29 [Rhinichthys klamathensis goyatoka]|uniref:tripartite motif-containing protein 29 n=1 Tax=Rhinichthys klamathensis goyatoka TaxID=3034132 RepID=UPI0024B51BB1|nr:tripartite motif-containing protein 29 [Rhinichthys klamathensis goyatoka]
MAEASISVGQDQFICPVCLDLLKNPVTIPCGHSYCMSCITGCWNQDDQKGVHSCPQCRQTFTPRPVLGKNVVFAQMVEKLKMTKLQATGSGDLECDVCFGRKLKAVKSCLVCLESYCQTHFERHEEFRSGNPHKVIDATGRLQQMICPQHGKQLEIFCRTDQRSICYLCTMDEHKYHDTVTSAAERTEKQKHLEQTLSNFHRRIWQREKDLQELREVVKTYKRSAQTAVEDSERNFTELIRSIERSRSEVTQLIRDQENAAVSQAEGLLKQLEKEIDDLRRRNTELEQLSNTDDHIHFLLSVEACSVPPKTTVVPTINASSLLLYEDVGKSVLLLKKKLEDFCKEEIKKTSDRVAHIEIISTSEESLELPPPSPKPMPRSLSMPFQKPELKQRSFTIPPPRPFLANTKYWNFTEP